MRVQTRVFDDKNIRSERPARHRPCTAQMMASLPLKPNRKCRRHAGVNPALMGHDLSPRHAAAIWLSYGLADQISSERRSSG